MPLETQLVGGLTLALAIVYFATPVAIRVADRFEFYDKPAGYKGHARPTPYLGGAAVVAGFILAVLIVTRDAQRTLPLLVGVVALWAVGTVDDRRTVSPGLRVLVEVALALMLWQAGLGWELGLGSAVDAVVTAAWIVGVVNAFNLFDNMDGQASSMALVVTAAVALLGVIEGDVWLAVAGAALAGSCLGFLPHNLASPGARIFLGDGGSMPVGFAAASLVMIGAGEAAETWQGFGLGLLLVGLPALDTALVVISRTRRGIPILTGGRDHLTHRTRQRLATARGVALALGSAQAVLAVLGLVAIQGGSGVLVFAVALYLLGTGLAIAVLDGIVSAPAAAAPGPGDASAGAVAGAVRAGEPSRAPGRIPAAAAILVPLGLLLGLSAFEGGGYATRVWAPAGLVLLVILTAALIARPPALSRLATTALVALTGLAAWSLASVQWADSAEQAVVEGNRLAVYAAMLALVLVLVRDRRAAVVALGAVAVGGIAVGAIDVVRMLGDGGARLFVAGRLDAPLGYINGQAHLFLLVAWPCLAVAERRRSPVLAGAGLGLVTLLAGLMLLSQSRGVAVAAIASVACVLVVAPGRLVRLWALAVAAVALVGVGPDLLDVYRSLGPDGEVAPAAVRTAGGSLLLASVLSGLIWGCGCALAGAAERAGRGGALRTAARGATALAGVCVAVLALASFGTIRDVASRQYSAFVTLGVSQGGEQTSSRLVSGAGTRYDYWRIAGRTWEDQKLRGVGAGGYDRPYFAQRTTPEDVRQPHSLLLQALAELGLVGGALVALLLVALLAAAVGKARRVAGRTDAGLLVASLGIVSAWIAHTNVDWIHLLPGLTGIAMVAAAVLLRRDAPSAPVEEGDPVRRPRRWSSLVVAVGAGLLLLVAGVSLSRQVLAEEFRDRAQDALATRPADALENADRSLRLDASALPTYYVKAAAFARFDRPEDAEATLLEAVRREPGDFVTYALLGDLAVRQGRFDEARRRYGQASRLNPRDAGLAELASDPRAALR